MSRKQRISSAAVDFAREAAEIVRQARDNTDSNREYELISSVAVDFALMFKRDNPHFDAGDFFELAGFPEITGTRKGLNR